MYIASDHAGYNLKNIIKKFISKKGIKIIDIGPDTNQRVDYPDFAHKLSKNWSTTMIPKQLTNILILGPKMGSNF